MAACCLFTLLISIQIYSFMTVNSFPHFRLYCLLLFFISCRLTSFAQPVRVIFDTDMGNDIDDALALAMIHAFESRGEARLLAVTLTKDNKWAAPYIDAVNTFYGRSTIPVGVVKNGKTPEDHNMIKLPADRKNPDETYVYPRKLNDYTKVPEAVSLLRSILAKEADQSVVIIQVGFSTNLARLLDSKADQYSPLAGKELVKRKVKLLSAMAGAFPSGEPEYNVHMDLPAAQKLFSEWPTPIIASGFEIGLSILYPAASIEKHFAYVKNHPVADAYRSFDKMPYNRPTWDLTSVLYAIRPDDGYFSLSEKGKIVVKADKKTYLEKDTQGQHQYLIVNEAQRKRILEALMYLSSQPPGFQVK